MRYAVWIVRLIYAAWMIPAGLNHFIQLYPQPLGNEPLSIAVFTALLDSGLFTLVKAVELLAGVMLLLGWRVPLSTTRVSVELYVTPRAARFHLSQKEFLLPGQRLSVPV